MFKQIQEERVAKAIAETYRYQTETSCAQHAARICRETDEKFEPLMQAWLDGEPLPDIREGKYSVDIIMQIRQSTDFLMALKLLNDCRKDPEAGEAAIWRPDRALSSQARMHQ